MTAPTNTFQTYAQIGRREDLEDVIYNISPTDTPFMSSIGKGKAASTYHEWQTDTLASPNSSNAQIEGDDATNASLSATTRVGNYTQIMTKTIVTSGTADAVKTAGRGSEMAYYIAKAGQELKRDIETILLLNQASVVGNSTTARKMRSLDSWYASNVSAGAGGGNGSSSTARTDGTQRAFTEALLKTALQSVWNSGGNATLLMLGGTQKQTFSGFTGNATRYNDNISGKTGGAVVSGASIYISDFGQLSVVANRFQRARDAHIIDPEMASLAYLRPFQTLELARTGDAEKKMLVAEATLVVKNEAAHGIVADLL